MVSLLDWLELFPEAAGTSYRLFEMRFWDEPWMARPLKEANCARRDFLKHIYDYIKDPKIAMFEVFCDNKTQWIELDANEFTHEVFQDNPMA